MTARNMDMETITASLERSLQNFSLDNNNDDNQIRRRQEEEQGSSISDIVVAGIGSSDQIPDTTLELNSHLSLPCHWEQCLDLKVYSYSVNLLLLLLLYPCSMKANPSLNLPLAP